MSSDASVTIDRLNCRFRMRPAPAGPFAVRDRFRAAIERELPSACAEALATPDDAGAPVYRIRDVRIRVWSSAQKSEPGELARHCGALLAKAIEDAMRGAPSTHAVRFASPGAYLAAFLRELLDGHAWSRWYFKDFAPLRPLPTSLVASRLLVARPRSIAAVLSELHETGHARKLIDRWRQPELAAIWEALGFTAGATAAMLATPAGARLLARVAASWTPDPPAHDATARARRALRAWLVFAQAEPEAATDPEAGAVLRALVDLEAALSVEPSLAEPGTEALARLAAGPLADVAAWAGALLATPAGPGVMARLAAVAAPARTPTARRRARRTSPFAGVALVGPALAEVGLWERWVASEGLPAAHRHVLVTWLKALGRERAPVALGDGVLAALAGSDPSVGIDAPGDAPPVWLEAAADAAGRPGPAAPAIATIDGLTVVRGGAQGVWLAAVPEAHAAALRARFPDAGDLDHDVLAPEAQHLQLGLPWLGPGVDAAVSVAASLALRRTAARLPGLGRSSPSYLASQFLAQSGTLAESADALEVTLDAVPLSVVLQMSGLLGTWTVPWLDRELRIRLRGGQR